MLRISEHTTHSTVKADFLIFVCGDKKNLLRFIKFLCVYPPLAEKDLQLQCYLQGCLKVFKHDFPNFWCYANKTLLDLPRAGRWFSGNQHRKMTFSAFFWLSEVLSFSPVSAWGFPPGAPVCPEQRKKICSLFMGRSNQRQYLPGKALRPSSSAHSLPSVYFL